MCTGRVDLAFITRALAKGADGVFVGGCWPGECHYVTEGNYDALGNMLLCKKLLAQVGVNPDRLRLEWVSASEGSRFAEVVDDFVRQLKELGPTGSSEGLAPDALAAKIAAIDKLIPYIKLVERERLRVPHKDEAAYKAYYDSAETTRLFDELVASKLVVGEILALLKERPLSTGEISEALGLTPSEVNKTMNTSSRQGLVRYDVDEQCFVLA
jgi:F420-non-reducing hydrogenase iron-sulfur subunit